MNTVDNTRYVFLHSLFDERKCAQRFSFELKCAFENADKTLERPDYYGTGDSDGDFCEVNLSTLRKDIAQFCSYGNCVLIGLRFGANLILDYLNQTSENVSGLILINPIDDLKSYVEYIRRKQWIKDIMTGFKDDVRQQEQYVNVEGYKTQKRFLEELESYGEVNFQIDSQVPVNIISNENLNQTQIKLDITKSRYLPFWERIPPQNHSQLIDFIVKMACSI